MPSSISRDTFNDEIDLRELLLTLRRSKWLILFIVVVTTAIAVIYVLLATPMYKSQVTTSAPTPNELTDYNLVNNVLGLPSTSADDAYLVFVKRLQSAELRQSFFEKVYRPDHPSAMAQPATAALRATLDQQLSIQTSGSNGLGPATITWQGADSHKIAIWLNQYVEMARSSARKQLVAMLRASVWARIQKIDNQINGLRVAVVTARENKILQLKDALKIAEAVQITKPLSAGNLVASFEGTAAYLRGSEALQAEIKLLEAHRKDDAQTPEISKLLYTKNLLRSAKIDPELLTTATIDQAAIAPRSPMRPRKNLVISLSVLLGLTIGVIAALIRHKLRAD